MNKTIGQVAYEAYRRRSKRKSLVSGQPIPTWRNLPEKIRAAWESAGKSAYDRGYEDGWDDGWEDGMEKCWENCN